MGKEPIQSVQTFGRKKTATAVAYCKRGKGLIKVNGRPLELVEPRALAYKLQEPILLLGKDRVADTPARSMPSGRHSPSLWLPTIRSMLMNSPSRRSRTSLSSSTGPSWLLTPGGTNQRSLADLEPEQDSRNLTVRVFIWILQSWWN